MKKIIRFIYRQLQLFNWYKSLGYNSGVMPWGSRVWNKRCISIGNNSTIWKNSSLLVTTKHNWNTYNPQVNIWNNVSIWNGLFLACIDGITIEDDVLFSDRVFISDHIHWYEDIQTPVAKQDLKARWEVLIKTGSFIGINVIIHPWVTIWKNSVIWASSVVINNIPDYCVAVWNPAKVIKKYDQDAQQWISVSHKNNI